MPRPPLWSVLMLAALGVAPAAGQATSPAAAPAAAPAAPATAPATAPSTAPSVATTAPISGDVADLITQLSNDSWAVRQSAQEALVRLGDSAKPALNQLLQTTTDPEARTRAETALQQIDDNRATGPSIITIKMTDVPPKNVIDELSAQAFAPLPLWPEELWKQRPWRNISVDIDHKPFWEAFRQISKQTGLCPTSMGPERRFVLMENNDESILGPASYDGPFMVVANSVTRSSSISFARQAAPSRSLSIQFTVFAEPKLNVLGHDYSLMLSEAVDDKGNSLLLRDQNGFGMINQDMNSRWSLGAALAQPENAGTRLARLRGSCRVMMQTRGDKWELENPAAAQSASKVIGPFKYVFDSVRGDAGNNTWQVKMTMTRVADKAPLRRLMPGRNFQPDMDFFQAVHVTLLDSTGKPMNSNGYGRNGSDQRQDFTFTFTPATPRQAGPPPPPPSKLILEVPTEVKEREIKFSFNDLPLP